MMEKAEMGKMMQTMHKNMPKGMRAMKHTVINHTNKVKKSK